MYDLYKRLAFIDLTPNDQGYTWEARLQNQSLLGTVFPDGEEIRVTGEDDEPASACPICLARNTRIAAPGGFVRVQDVRVGMTVWSTNAAGRRIRSVVLAVGRTPVPPTHRVVRLVLADGRTVLVSPGHPTPDGDPVGAAPGRRRFRGNRAWSRPG